MFSQTHAMAVQVCEQIKTRRPDSVTAIGGVHVTNCFLHRKMFETVARDFAGADLFFLFEAEFAFRYFVAVVNGSAPAAGLYQIYFNTPSSKVYFSVRKTPTKKELDVIPAYDLMGVEHLAENGVIGSFTCLKSDHRRYGTVLSNRGCRGRCTYCSVRNFNGPGVRCRSVSSIIEELRMMREQFGIDHIMWLDDDLLFDHRRAIRLFTEMIRQDIGITWDCTNGVIAASCTDEIIAAAEESGCIGMNIGVESGNPEVLKRIRKPGTLEDFLNAAAVFKRHERINARVFLMIGFPEETYRMILDTYALAVRMDLDWYNITTLQPLPNTPIFDSMLQQGLVTIPDPTQVRYNSGPYGKKRELMIRHRLPEHFKNPFENVDLAAAPPPSEHEAIWLYLNYHLNFKPLFGLHHPVKLQQRLKYLRYITEQVAPDDPFPVYFYGLLQHRINGKTDGALVSRLEGILESSGYWRNCFRYFRLAPSQLSGGAIPAEATI